MGMLIRRHRDRHEGEHVEAEVIEGPTKADLIAEAKALGLSIRGSKMALAVRIAEHHAEAGKAHDAESDKTPSTEPDPGAGGDNPAAPAPAEGAGTPDPDAPGGEGTTEGTPSSE